MSSPQSDKSGLGEEVTAVRAELADVVDQLSREDKLNDIQKNQDNMLMTLDQVLSGLRKAQSVKYVTKSELDGAISDAWVAVDTVKSVSCDYDCMNKIEALETRLAALEAKCSVITAAPQYTLKSGGSTGSLSSNVYSTVGGGGSTGNISTLSYPQQVAIEMPSNTRTVKVVEPRTRRQVNYAEVPSNVQQCYINESGQQVCSPQATPRRMLGSRLFGGR